MDRENEAGSMLELKFSGQFKREYRLMQKQGKDMSLLLDAVDLLKKGIPLDEKYQDHLLVGKYKGCRECHIRPGW